MGGSHCVCTPVNHGWVSPPPPSGGGVLEQMLPPDSFPPPDILTHRSHGKGALAAPLGHWTFASTRAGTSPPSAPSSLHGVGPRGYNLPLMPLSDKCDPMSTPHNFYDVCSPHVVLVFPEFCWKEKLTGVSKKFGRQENDAIKKLIKWSQRENSRVNYFPWFC